MFLSRLIRFSLTSIVVLCVASAALALDTPNNNKLVAKVGNISISQQDLQRELQRLIPMSLSFHGGVKAETIQKLQGEALQSLIDRAYKVQYAIDEELTVDAQKVEETWQNFKSSNSKRLTAASATDLERLKAELYINLLAEKAEEESVDKLVEVDESEVKSFYEKNKSNYLQPKLFTASHVFVKVDPSATREVKEQLKLRADELYSRAKTGEDFYNLAYYESDDRSKYVGGKLGSFHAGQTVEEFDQALQKMAPGEISEPVQTIYGYHIIRLDEVMEERQLSYDEAAEKIRANAAKSSRTKLYEAWMTLLQKKYPLQKFDD